jgi:protein arginine N-methyltransferase 1
MSEVAGYSIAAYGKMIDSDLRMGCYAGALRAAIVPGCTVIDIGASFGMFPILACRYGAGRVIAIEPDPSVELIGPLAQANGCADRIEIVRGVSSELQLDDPADVLISDLRGILPLFQSHIPMIRDARARLLKPGGALLPQKDTLHAALVRSARVYRTISHPWMHNDYGVDLSLGLPLVANCITKAELTGADMASAPVFLAELDYRSIEAPDLDATVSLIVDNAGPVHGIAAWFDAEIAPGFSFSNAPREPTQVYGQMFFPFERPMELAAGSSVEVRLRARLIDGDYTFAWDSHFGTAGDRGALPPMRQSTFKTHILTADALRQRDAARVPAPTRDMAVERSVLELVDGENTLHRIAEILLTCHPDELGDYKSALDRATKAVLRYG